MDDYVANQQMFDVLYQLANEESLKLAKSAVDINSLPEVEISQSEVGQKLICAICLKECELQLRTKKLSCSYMFHKDCIAPWLEDHDDCPFCRSLCSRSMKDCEAASRVGSLNKINNENFPELRRQ